MTRKKIYSFSIEGFTTQREWSVYVVVAIPTNPENNERKLYVGKVGDNSNGCNPIITRIGNHLSHYDDHSQLRNKLDLTTEYDYHIYFVTFGQYIGKDKSQLDKINQLERELNKIIQSKLADKDDCILLNSYSGKYHIKQAEREKRSKLLTDEDIKTLGKLANQAVRKAIRKQTRKESTADNIRFMK